MLADDIEYKLPDGDADTRTTFKGIDAVKEHWSTYLASSGNTAITITLYLQIGSIYFQYLSR